MTKPIKTKKAYFSNDYLPNNQTSKEFLRNFFSELNLDRGEKAKLRQQYLENRLEAFYRIMSTLIVRTELSPENYLNRKEVISFLLIN